MPRCLLACCQCPPDFFLAQNTDAPVNVMHVFTVFTRVFTPSELFSVFRLFISVRCLCLSSSMCRYESLLPIEYFFSAIRIYGVFSSKSRRLQVAFANGAHPAAKTCGLASPSLRTCFVSASLRKVTLPSHRPEPVNIVPHTRTQVNVFVFSPYSTFTSSYSHLSPLFH